MAIVTTSNESVGPRCSDWRAEIKAAFRDPIELCRALKLPSELARNSANAQTGFSFFAPRPFVNRIEQGNINDPLLLQLLPTIQETEATPGFSIDPVDDATSTLAPGVIHKYRGRALLIATGVCAINCRYCFRRNYPYEKAPKGTENWDMSLTAVRDDSSIEEVILSGGDPLMLNDESLFGLVEQIESIEHVRRLRIHTRLPIMIPSRVTGRLVSVFQQSRLVPVVVIHCNHAQEIDGDVERSLSKLVNGGIPVLNQSVLLKGINDNLEVLVELSKRLIDQRVMPYYLNQLDRVQGAAHFEVQPETGKQLVREMRNHLPGYAVPRYVAEIAGEKSKTIIS